MTWCMSDNDSKTTGRKPGAATGPSCPWLDWTPSQSPNARESRKRVELSSSRCESCCRMCQTSSSSPIWLPASEPTGVTSPTAYDTNSDNVADLPKDCEVEGRELISPCARCLCCSGIRDEKASTSGDEESSFSAPVTEWVKRSFPSLGTPPPSLSACMRAMVARLFPSLSAVIICCGFCSTRARAFIAVASISVRRCPSFRAIAGVSTGSRGVAAGDDGVGGVGAVGGMSLDALRSLRSRSRCSCSLSQSSPGIVLNGISPVSIMASQLSSRLGLGSQPGTALQPAVSPGATHP